jgi:hypothetical protein
MFGVVFRFTTLGIYIGWRACTEGMRTQAEQLCYIGQCHQFLFLNCDVNPQEGEYSPKWVRDKPLGIFPKMGQESLSIFGSGIFFKICHIWSGSETMHVLMVLARQRHFWFRGIFLLGQRWPEVK